MVNNRNEKKVIMREHHVKKLSIEVERKKNNLENTHGDEGPNFLNLQNMITREFFLSSQGSLLRENLRINLLIKLVCTSYLIQVNVKIRYHFRRYHEYRSSGCDFFMATEKFRFSGVETGENICCQLLSKVLLIRIIQRS